MPAAIVPLLAAVGGSAFVTAAGTLTALGTIVSAGISLGFSYGINALFGDKGRNEAPKPQDIKAVLKSSVAARNRYYGTLKVGGALAFIEPRELDLAQLIVFGQGPISGYREFFVDDRPVTLDGGVGGGSAVNSPYDGSSVRIFPEIGSDSQGASVQMLLNFPAVWTPNHRLQGLAYAVVYLSGVKAERLNDVYPRRENTTVTAVIDGAAVYDPRSGGTGFSKNFALFLRDYITHPDGARLPASSVDDGLIIVAANACDEAVPTKSGLSIARYHGQLAYSLETEPKDVLDRIVKATDGRIFLTPAGKIGFLAGKWIEPTVHITDEQIIDADLSDGAGPFASSNEVVIKYTFPEARYSEATSDPWRDDASIATDGRIPVTPEIYDVQHHNHARRLAKLIAHRAKPRWTGTIRTTLQGMKAFDQRWIRVSIADGYGIVGETFEVNGWSLETDTMTVILEIASFSGDAYDFNPAAEEGTAPTIPTDIENAVTIPEPSGFTLTTADRSSGGVTYRAAVFSANPPFLINTYTVFEISSDADANWQEVSHPIGSDVAEFAPLVDGRGYYGRAKSRSLSGRESGYTEILGIDGQEIPPALPPVSFSAFADGPNVSYLATAANDPSTRGLQFRRGTTSQPFGDAAIILDALANANDARSGTDTPPSSGTYRYWVASRNATGVLSPTSPIDATV